MDREMVRESLKTPEESRTGEQIFEDGRNFVNSIQNNNEIANEAQNSGRPAIIIKFEREQLSNNGSSKSDIQPKPEPDSKTVDSRTGKEVGRFVVDPKGNTMIEPKGGTTIPAGKNGQDTHTTYPNGSNYQRLNPNGHGPGSTTPHGHGHLEGTSSGRAGQGTSIDSQGNEVPFNSKEAHWPIN
jgi:hypothetical protein